MTTLNQDDECDAHPNGVATGGNSSRATVAPLSYAGDQRSPPVESRLERVTRPALGYIRVSSEKQVTDGLGLNHQEAAIWRYADRHGYELRDIYKDVASGRGPQSWLDRGGLQQVLREAKRQHVPIIAWDASRITRHFDTHEKLHSDPDLAIHYARDDVLGQVPGSSPEAGLRAEEVTRNIAAGTKAGIEAGRAAGAQFGSKEALVLGRQTSLLKRKTSAAARIHSIADVLRVNRGHETLSVRELADLLNLHGVRTAGRKDWTVPALRRPLREARKLLALWRDLESLPLDDFAAGPVRLPEVRPAEQPEKRAEPERPEGWGRF